MIRAWAGRGTVAFAVGLMACACGDSSHGEATTTATTMIDTLRIDLRGSATSLHVDGVKHVAIGMNALSTATLTGDFLAIGYAGAEVKSVQAVQFATIRRAYANDERARREDTAPVEESTAVLFLPNPSALDRVKFVDKSGAVVAAIDSATMSGPTESPTKILDQPASPPTACRLTQHPDIELKLPDGANASLVQLAHGWSSNVTLVDPCSYIDAIDNALSLLSNRAVWSIRRIAVAMMDDPIAAYASGAEIVVRDVYLKTRTAEFPYILAHEAGHAVEHRFDSDIRVEQWQGLAPAELEAVRAEHERLRLVGVSLPSAWQSIQDLALRAGVPNVGVYDDSWKDRSSSDDNTEALDEGFASAYGHTTPSEDIGDYVASVQLGRPRLNQSSVCGRFFNALELDAALAVPFVKIQLLRALRAVDDDRVTSCLSGVDVPSTPGIHFDDTWNLTTNMHAGAPTLSRAADSNALELSATGDERRVTIVLPNETDALPVPGSTEPSSRLGMYRFVEPAPGLDPREALYDPGEQITHTMLLEDLNDPTRLRGASSGLLVITEDSTEATRGAIFSLRLYSMVDGTPFDTDERWFTTFAIPHH